MIDVLFLTSAVILIFLSGCLQLLDVLPESVYRVCNLIMVMTVRNGPQWRTEILTTLINEVLINEVLV